VRKVYALLALLLFLATLFQFFFAAVGAFDEPRDDGSFTLHRMTGMIIIPALAVLATIAAALSRAGGKLIGLTILPVGLILLQMLIKVIAEAFDEPNGDTSTASVVIFGFHAINGLVTMAVARSVMMAARKRATAAEAPASAPAEATAAAN